MIKTKMIKLKRTKSLEDTRATKSTKQSSKVSMKASDDLGTNMKAMKVSSKDDLSVSEILKIFQQKKVNKSLILDYINKTKVELLQQFGNLNHWETIKISVAKYLVEYDLQPDKKKYVKKNLKPKKSSVGATAAVEWQESPSAINQVDHYLWGKHGLKPILTLNDAKKISYAISKKVEEYYSFLTPYVDRVFFEKIFRPQIYFDFSMKYPDSNRTKVGRLVFQLFTEACPGVVMQLVKVCLKNNFEKFQFQTLYENVWLECSLMMDSEKRKNFTKKFDCLKDISSAWILSFPNTLSEDEYAPEILELIISKTPMKVTGFELIPFGVLHRGSWFLLQLLQSANGQECLCDHVKIIKCGALNCI